MFVLGAGFLWGGLAFAVTRALKDAADNKE